MLLPIGWLYGKIADIRNALYDRAVLKSYSLGARTISIGNLTTGGTGKTPLVMHVAEILADSGEKVCVLTRGYGREKSHRRVLVSDGTEVLVDARAGGDEPVEIAGRLIGKAIVIADSDRVSAAGWARKKFGITAFVLDDGFQHRRAKRDVDIVCIETTIPFRFCQMLPVGNLREPVQNLERADAIVLTRAELAAPSEAFVGSVKELNPAARIFRAEARFRDLRTLDAFLSGDGPGEELRITPQTLAFCGLGNPQSFMTMLANQGTTLSRPFPDHYRYTQADIKRIEYDARAYGCDQLVTTAKDAVKLKGLNFELPCLVAEMEVVIDDHAGLRELLTSS